MGSPPENTHSAPRITPADEPTTVATTLCVIVTYNAANYVKACVLAALDATGGPVLVWDNGSSDETVAVAQELQAHGDVTVVAHTENLGFSRGVNAAVATAQERGLFPTSDSSILLLNPDCILSAETFARLREILSREKSVGVVSPAMRLPDGSLSVAGGPTPTLLKEFLARTQLDELLPAGVIDAISRGAKRLNILPSLHGFRETQVAREPVKLDWVSGFCMLIRRDTWAAVGGMDPDFFLYFEDVAFCIQARRRGWDAVCDATTSALHDESSSARFNSKNKHYYASMWIFLAKYGSRPARAFARMRTAL